MVALLSVFSQAELAEHLLGGRAAGSAERFVTRDEIEPKALCKSALFALAEQMGSALEGVRGQPLRQSAVLEPDPRLKDTEEFLEEHNRGEWFVAAVLQGLVQAWSHRIKECGLEGQRRFPVRRVDRP